jgi:hypothetical protein
MKKFLGYWGLSGDCGLLVYSDDEMPEGKVDIVDWRTLGVSLYADADAWSQRMVNTGCFAKQEVVSLIESFGVQMWALICSYGRVKVCVWNDKPIVDKLQSVFNQVRPVQIWIDVEDMGNACSNSACSIDNDD